MGVIKGDTRSLDNGSCRLIDEDGMSVAKDFPEAVL